MLNMREAWTDERLDDFARDVDKRFDRLEGKMEEGFSELRGEIKDVRKGINEVTRAVMGFQRAMVQFCAVLVAAQMGVIATLVVGLN